MAQVSAEKLEHTGPAEKKRVASVPESSWQVCQSCPCQKEKEQNCLSRVPDCKMGESQGKREPFLGEREGVWGESMGEKGGLHHEGRQVPRRKERTSKKNLPRRSRRKHEWVGRCKSSPGGSAESWFHSKSGQT